MLKKIMLCIVMVALWFFVLSLGHVFSPSAFAFDWGSYEPIDLYESLADKLNIDLEKALISHIALPMTPRKMKLIDDKLYVINDDFSLQIIDVCDPNTMKVNASFNFQLGGPLSLYTGENWTTINDINALSKLNTYGSRIFDFSIDNNNLYLTSGHWFSLVQILKIL